MLAFDVYSYTGCLTWIQQIDCTMVLCIQDFNISETDYHLLDVLEIVEFALWEEVYAINENCFKMEWSQL